MLPLSAKLPIKATIRKKTGGTNGTARSVLGKLGCRILAGIDKSELGPRIGPSIPDWGQDISAHYQSINAGYWWPVLFPSLAIATLIVGINLIADAIAQLFER